MKGPGKALGSLVLAGLVGIGLGLAAGSLAPPAGREAPQGSAALQHRQAPDFSLPGTQTAETIRLASYQGKVVLLNFFETGCPHCQEEIPELVKLHQALRAQGVEVIGVALDPVKAKQLRRLAAEHGIAYPLAIGNEELATRYGGIAAVPTSFVIDRNGRVIEVFSGAVGYATLLKAVRAAL